MKDRVPASGKGGRVSLALESFGVANNTLSLTSADGAIYGILGHADNAVQVGSMYNKANVLPASVTSALGLTDASAEPKDAFTALNSKINTANNNLSTVTNLVSGNYASISVSNYKSATIENDPNDFRSSATNCTDFLISTTEFYSGSETLAIAVGSVIFTRDLPNTGSNQTYVTTSHKVRIYKSGNVWLAQWGDGVFEWKDNTNGSGSIVVKAYIVGQNYLKDDEVKSLTIKGR